jgi:hypothetical protein
MGIWCAYRRQRDIVKYFVYSVIPVHRKINNADKDEDKYKKQIVEAIPRSFVHIHIEPDKY